MRREMIMVVMIVAVLVVLLTVLPNFMFSAEESAVKSACKKSLETLENLRLISGNLIVGTSGDSASIMCSTEYIKTPSKGEKLTSEIANHAFECWSTYGIHPDLFDIESGTYCIVCKSITSESRETIEPGLVDYLKHKKAPSLSGETYSEAVGGEFMFPSGSEAEYNHYSFDEETAMLVVYGSENSNADFLVLDRKNDVGLAFVPYKNIVSVGCSVFEGRSNSLDYTR